MGLWRGRGLDDWNGDDPIIVSAMVADALAKQGKTYGVYYPDTGPDSVVRDAEGNILGVRRMAFMGKIEPIIRLPFRGGCSKL